MLLQISHTPGSVPAKTVSPEGGWVMRSHIMDCEILHQLEKETKHSLPGCGNLSLADTVSKNLRRNLKTENTRKRISTSGGFVQLHSNSSEATSELITVKGFEFVYTNPWLFSSCS